MAETLSVQIALEGGKEIQAQLEDIGTAGTRAFSDISAAASKVGGFDNLDPSVVTKKMQDFGITTEDTMKKITDAVKAASRWETVVNAVKAVENAFTSLGATVTKVVTILAKHEAASLGLGRAGVAAATAIVTAFGPLGVIIAVIAVAVAALGVVFVGAAKSIQALDAEAIKLNSTFEQTSQIFLGLRAAGVSTFAVISQGLAQLQSNIDKLTLAAVEKAFASAQKNIAAGWGPAAADLKLLQTVAAGVGPAADAARKALEAIGRPIQDNVTPALKAMIDSAGGAIKAIPQLATELTHLGTAGERARLVSELLQQIQIESGNAEKALLPMLQALEKMPPGVERNKAVTDAFAGALGVEIAQLLNAGVSISQIIEKTKGLSQGQADAANQIVQTMNRITAGISAALENIPVEKLNNALKSVAGSASEGFGGATTSVGTMSKATDDLNAKLAQTIQLMNQIGSGTGGGDASAPSGFAGGGVIGGRGTGTSDSNLAWVSRGEYISYAGARGGATGRVGLPRGTASHRRRPFQRDAWHGPLCAWRSGHRAGVCRRRIIRHESCDDCLSRCAADRRPARVGNGGRRVAPRRGDGTGAIGRAQTVAVFLMPAYTLLAIDAIDFSDYAIRGITMTLEPIAQAASLARDCRGMLADISLAQFRQFKITIACTDQEAPQLTNIWPGQDISITCIPGVGVPDDPAGQLTFLAKVTTWNTSRDEWAAETAWKLEAEQRAIS